jgi:hypothetical protein
VIGQLELFDVGATGRDWDDDDLIAAYADRIPGWAWDIGAEQQYTYGLWHGYPQCCIEAFCRDEPRPADWLHAAQHLGYVPCNNCHTRMTSHA